MGLTLIVTLIDRYAYLARLRRIRPYMREALGSTAPDLAVLSPGQTELDPESSGNGVDGRFRTLVFQSGCPLPDVYAAILLGCTTGNCVGTR